MGFSLRRKKAGRDMPGDLAAVRRVRLVSAMRPTVPRNSVRHVSALHPSLRPPCLGLCPALAASPNFVRHRLCPPCVRPRVRFGCASKPCLPCVCPAFKKMSAMCPLKPCRALGLLWGRAAASSGKILSHACATHRPG